MIYLKDFFCAFGATLFFCILFSAPRRSIIYSSLIAAASWLLYDVIKFHQLNELIGYFCSVLLIGFLSEWGARHYKMPSIIILFPALIPYIPGVGIYNAMFYMVTNDYDMFLTTLVQTLLIAATIALAVTVANLFFIVKHDRKEKEISHD